MWWMKLSYFWIIHWNSFFHSNSNKIGILRANFVLNLIFHLTSTKHSKKEHKNLKNRIHFYKPHTTHTHWKRATAQDLNSPFFRKLSKNMTMVIAREYNRKILNSKKVVKSIGIELLYHNIQQWWWCSTIDMKSAKIEQGTSKCWAKKFYHALDT